MMKITNVRLKMLEETGRAKAVASIVFDDAFVIHGLRVIETDSKMFVAMPSKRGKDGEFRDVAHPLQAELRNQIESVVLEVYEKEMIKE